MQKTLGDTVGTECIEPGWFAVPPAASLTVALTGP